MILLTGSTGTTGRDVLSGLAKLGVKDVRVMVRDASRASVARESGFEVIEGDFERPETLRPALEGVKKAFLLTGLTPDTVAQQTAFIEAARSAGVGHVVKFSAIGAHTSAPGGFIRWHGEVEETLKNSGLAWTMLKPGYFMQNLLGQAATIASRGAIHQPAGDARAGFVDTRDVAAVAARVLAEDGHENRSYVITGPEALSYRDVADRLSEATGRRISYVPITHEQFREGALGAGLPVWLVDALELLNRFFVTGEAAEVTDVVRNIGGKEPNTFARFAHDYAAAFAPQPAK